MRSRLFGGSGKSIGIDPRPPIRGQSKYAPVKAGLIGLMKIIAFRSYGGTGQT